MSVVLPHWSRLDREETRVTRTVLHGGRIFDGTGSPVADGDLVIEDGRIVTSDSAWTVTSRSTYPA